MNKKNITLSILIPLLVAAGIFSIIYTQKNLHTKDDYSHKEIIDIVTRDNPALVNNRKPVIDVVSVKQPEKKWYVVVIKSIHDQDMKVPVKFILVKQSQSSRNLSLLLGPDTYFTESELLQYNVPDSVIIELQKS